MPSVAVVFVLTITLRAIPSVEMGPPIRRGETRIVNGRPATPKEFPYMAYIRSADDSGKQFIDCGGSLITIYAVLTSAHCVDGFTKYTVGLGSIYHTGVDRNVWTVVSVWDTMHPEYKRDTADNDIAIIHLPKRAPWNEFIQPVWLPCAPVVSSFVGRPAIISGWGYIFPYSGLSDVLRWAEVVVLPNDSCKKFFSNFALTDRQLCAGADTTTAYWNDYGGPLVIMTGGRYVQIGIFSRHSEYYNNTSPPATYTRVKSFIDWIESKTKSDQE